MIVNEILQWIVILFCVYKINKISEWINSYNIIEKENKENLYCLLNSISDRIDKIESNANNTNK